MIKIIIADDQVLFLQGLRLQLKDEEDLSIIGEANNGLEVIDLIQKEKPNIVITDIQMPVMDGVELTRLLRQHYPEIKVIGLTVFEEDYLIVDMIEAGARGYLLKSTTKEQLVEAIKAVQANGIYYCDHTSLKVLKKIAATRNVVTIPAGIELNETEKQIIKLISQQFSSKEIGARLNLGRATIEGYRIRIFNKMGVKNMAGLMVNAIRWGLVEIKN
jgi:DNA-binding NarL/FixJ family response regulator